ncbi:sulfide:quinone oxidoreductase, mitochondrial-like isoform X1 [Tachypleus tridentatus]|uniref:sulfide:quinone oxidoreductase, mitochondrial-like isoform X1 n=2 Tax=Tachypleus tridentatus TaxID=6853 RepID=UPI003FD54A03
MLTKSLTSSRLSHVPCGIVGMISSQAFSTTASREEKKSYKLVVVGGGSGGITMSAKFGSKLGKGNTGIIEPMETHYYQPYWTLVGGGMKNVENSGRPMKSVIPKTVDWIKDRVVSFEPDKNVVHTKNGHEISYDYLIVSMGLKLDFQKIKGLPEAFQTPGVCSNYSLHTVTKTPQAMKDFKEGNALFTLPNTPIKCAGAPQKVMYLTDAYMRKVGKRDKANFIYNTALGVMFSAPKYAAELLKVAKDRGIAVNFQHNLIEVNSDKKEAVFEKLSSDKEPKETVTYPYEMIHVTPPMSTPEELQKSPLVDTSGYLALNKHTLQHVKYPNIFGIGDCTNVPTSKTAAAIASQSGILRKNLKAVMAGKPLPSQYDGYTSCPLITGYNKCILAEFDFDLKPLETFPIDQGKERRLMWHVKKDFMPPLYWHLLLKGWWEGPWPFRKLFHLGMSR